MHRGNSEQSTARAQYWGLSGCELLDLIEAARNTPTDPVIQMLIDLLNHPLYPIVLRASDLLGDFHSDLAVDSLVNILKQPRIAIYPNVPTALLKIGSPQAIPLLVSVLTSSNNFYVQRAAAVSAWQLKLLFTKEPHDSA